MFSSAPTPYNDYMDTDGTIIIFTKIVFLTSKTSEKNSNNNNKMKIYLKN